MSATHIIFKIGGASVEAPPLNLNGYRLASKLLGEGSLAPNTDAGIQNLPVVLSASLTRNDATRTPAWISETMLGSEYGEAVEKLLELLFISGFQRPKDDKEKAPGEDPAVSRTGTI